MNQGSFSFASKLFGWSPLLPMARPIKATAGASNATRDSLTIVATSPAPWLKLYPPPSDWATSCTAAPIRKPACRSVNCSRLGNQRIERHRNRAGQRNADQGQRELRLVEPFAPIIA